MLVVLFHAAQIWRDMTGHAGMTAIWDRGWAGVDLFFVISGFVMVWVAAERSSGVASAGRFLFDRATRIYPLWWVFCALMALYFLITYGQPAAPDRYTGNGAILAFVQSIALWPTGDLPVLTVGWTLTFELAFYALFALLLLLPSRWRMPALLVWGAGLAAIWVTNANPPALPDSWVGILANPLCLEFVFGACVAWVIRHVRLSRTVGVICLYVGGMAFVGVMISGEALGGLPDIRSRILSFGLSAAILVMGVVVVEKHGGLNVPPSLRALGDASYTLYLSHLLVLLALKRIVEPFGLFNHDSVAAMMSFMAFGLIVSVIASIIGYKLLERPLLRLSRAILPKTETVS